MNGTDAIREPEAVWWRRIAGNMLTSDPANADYQHSYSVLNVTGPVITHPEVTYFFSSDPKDPPRIT